MIEILFEQIQALKGFEEILSALQLDQIERETFI